MSNDVQEMIRGWAEFMVRALDLADRFEVSGHRAIAATLRQMAAEVEDAIITLRPPLELYLS